MKLLVWDFDGTLGRWKLTWSEALAQALRAVDPAHRVTAEELRPHLRSGFPWHAPAVTREAVLSADDWWRARVPLFEQAYRSCGVDGESARQAALHVRDVVARPDEFERYHDALPALEAARVDGWTQVILSNHIPELPEIVRYLDIDRYMDRVLTSAALPAEKPNRLAFDAVLAAYPSARPIVMIGDNPIADVAGGRAVGMHAILVRAQHSGDDAIVSLDELPPLLRALSA
jgi:putative hydrolase of the HAD superfamily